MKCRLRTHWGRMSPRASERNDFSFCGYSIIIFYSTRKLRKKIIVTASTLCIGIICIVLKRFVKNLPHPNESIELNAIHFMIKGENKKKPQKINEKSFDWFVCDGKCFHFICIWSETVYMTDKQIDAKYSLYAFIFLRIQTYIIAAIVVGSGGDITICELGKSQYAHLTHRLLHTAGLHPLANDMTICIW